MERKNLFQESRLHQPRLLVGGLRHRVFRADAYGGTADLCAEQRQGKIVEKICAGLFIQRV